MNLLPRERRHEKNKQRIMDVAQKLIARNGYENVSLREIARQADYSPAGLYEYFDSKDHILSALRKRINSLMITAVRELPDYDSAQEQIIEMGLAYVDFAVEYSEYFNLINSLPPLRFLEESTDPGFLPFMVFQSTVENLISELEIRLPSGYGPEETTYSFWTMVHGMATLQTTHMQGYEADFESANRRTLETFITGLQTEFGEK